VVLFATFFPETPTFAARRFRRQLAAHLGYLIGASRCAAAVSCYQSALCEQLGITLARVKDEPNAVLECWTGARVALSAAQAIGRLKSSLDPTVVAPEIVAEGSRLLARLSRTLRNPSARKFAGRAQEALVLKRWALATALRSADPREIEALNGVVVGSATLGSDLTRARPLMQGKSNAVRT